MGVREATPEEIISALEPTIGDEVEFYVHQMERRGLGTLALNYADLTPLSSFEQMGDDYQGIVDKWAEQGIDITPLVYSLLYTNGLTEENLPRYSEQLHYGFAHFRSEPLDYWRGLWNGSEQQHGPTITRVVEATGAVDLAGEYIPAMTGNMIKGIHPNIGTPQDGFAYLTPQELATRIAHQFTEQILSGQAAMAIGEVRQDEALHYMFYRKMLAKSAEMFPDETLMAIQRQFLGFDMPGRDGIKDFNKHSMYIAAAGAFDNEKTLKMFHDILKAVKLTDLTPKTDEGKAAQESLMVFTDLSSEPHQQAKAEDQKIRERLASRKAWQPKSGLNNFVLGATVEYDDDAGEYRAIAA